MAQLLLKCSSHFLLSAGIIAALLLGACLLFPQVSYAQIIISEVYPNPTTGQAEWVELFNAGSQSINLATWKLQDKLSTPSDIFVFTDQVLAPQQFLVAELASAKLNNGADGVTLWQPGGILHESMDYASSEVGKSWQRTSRDAATFALSEPTKGSENDGYPLILAASSTPIATPTPTPSPTAAATPLPTPLNSLMPTPTPSLLSTPIATPQATAAPTFLPLPTATPFPTPSPSVSLVPSPTPTSSPESALSASLLAQIHLSEIMACPASGTEWVELYNDSAQSITVTNWKITDESGTSKTLQGQLPSHSWAVLSWTGSLLNNSGDGFIISTAQNQTFIQASYSDCTAGTSLVFSSTSTDASAGSWVSTTPTPGSANSIPANNSAITATTSTTVSLSTPLKTKAAARSSAPAQPELSSLSSATISRLPAISHKLQTDLSALFTLPAVTGQPTPIFPTAETGYSSTFINNPSEPPKTLIISGILSGLVTISSSSWLLYGKKITTILTALT